jgi:hypothetical protein
MRKAINLGMKLWVERENVSGFLGLWEALLLACHRPCLPSDNLVKLSAPVVKFLTVLFV